MCMILICKVLTNVPFEQPLECCLLLKVLDSVCLQEQACAFANYKSYPIFQLRFSLIYKHGIAVAFWAKNVQNDHLSVFTSICQCPSLAVMALSHILN
jgi:hypothetical protein